ncbi:MAG TPA: Smr/MutS family protein [Candidatus Eisenbacteria bacterium]|jgi:DNA mismatch repair protein MutS2|nr:Smr/MutS family protein [Candidatus Eisenbacteria bacterium]
MSRTAQEVLEFDKLRELLRLRTTCAPGRRDVDALAFTTDRSALEFAFAQIREAREWLRAERELGFGGLADPEMWLAQIAGPGTVLEPAQLLDAATLLDTSGWLRQQFREEAAKFPLLAARAASLGDFRDALTAIRRAILPNGEISDDASPALRRIRAGIAQTRESIQKALKQILRARNAGAGEDYVTLRNDRFVIPVRAENRRNVPGVVHGASGTGQTVFLEPLETLETNNQLVQLAEDEAAEILNILRGLTERLQVVRALLLAAADTIAGLDSIFARARFARDFDAAMPEFAQAGDLSLEAARHPVLEDKLRREHRAIVPMSLTLGGAEKLLVISGPNTGGKTVALKTTGLAALSAQSAIPVTAHRAVLPLFDRVLVDIGDEQSIAADLSTFSAHMINLKTMLEAATSQSLVLVDEMGTGTAPEEGAALAVALLDEFRAKNCIVLATTHHDRLKAYASTTPGVVNAAVEFDDVNLRPTYRLMVGVPGGSSGIAIAQRLGLATAMIERARSLLAPESREAADLIAYLHRSRDELDRMQQQMAAERHALEEERRKLRTEWVKRQQKRIEELEDKFTDMQKRFDENVARVVEAVKERELRAQLEKSTRRKVQDVRSEAREDLNAALVQTISESQTDLGVSSQAAASVSRDQLQPGARIRVRGFNKPVVLRRLDGSSAEIEAGPLRMKVAVDEIIAVEGAPAPKAPMARQNITVTSQSTEGRTDEINVIGSTVEEATERVDKFLDEAALANRQRVRVIHGHGTGALRKGLAQFLSSHPLVERVVSESDDRGGKAVTVVELRS